MKNSETLRSKLFDTLDGLQEGTIEPAMGKAIAATAMAICKTVELDLRAQSLLEDSKMTPLTLTSDPPAIPSNHTEETHQIVTDDQKISILKGLDNGLPVATIAKRLKLNEIDVALVIESHN